MHRPKYMTPAQEAFLRRLINRATVLRVESFYIRDWDRILMGEASKMISELKAKIEAKEELRRIEDPQQFIKRIEEA